MKKSPGARGSLLIELAVALPFFLLTLLVCLGLSLLAIDKIVAVYAHFMAVRAASVQTDGRADEVAEAQAAAILPRTLYYQQMAPPWRLRHVAQPRGAASDVGDNPIPGK